MPRIKSTLTKNADKKPRVAKKPITKTIHPKKKTKSILVDVIEDEEEMDDSLPNLEFAETSQTVKQTGGNEKDHDFELAPEEEIDRQKKFFSELASELATKDNNNESKSESNGKNKRSLGLYRRLVLKFVALVIVLAAAVFYFSFSKLTITLTLKGETINDNLLLKVTDGQNVNTDSIDSSDPRQVISGTVKEIKSTVKKTYPATGETYLGEEISGQVRIINNYNKSQSLVATTRLLSPDNKLYRLKNAVNVPAGGEVIVDIYADKPSADMAIEATNFTIPGLWLGLQDKIYAKSDNKFVYSQKAKKYVNVSDLEHATTDITNTLLASAKEQAGADLSENSAWLYLNDESPSVEIDAKKGTQQDEFSAQASGRIVAVYFPKDQVATLASAKLNLIIPDNKELTEFKPEGITYSLESYDADTKTATVKANFNGVMILKGDSEIIDPKQLVNLNAEQIATYLKAQPEIKDYELSFSPAFIKKAPSLVDRIKIVINKD